MTRSAPALLHPSDPIIALTLLTRLPLRCDMTRAQARGAQIAWAFPLAGVLVGGIGAACQTAGTALGLSPPLAAGLALVALVLVTGALHEDGLADCADGFWGGWDRARRLEIMRDSRIGAYGVLAIALAILLRWQAMSELTEIWSALLVSAALSRAAMTAVWTALPLAREDGLARSLGRPSTRTAVLAAALAVGLAALLLGLAGVLAALAAALGAALVGELAQRQIGGQSGDVLGAVQQVSEILCLLSLSIAL